MSEVTHEGLEAGLAPLTNLCKDHAEPLAKRGVTQQKLDEYAAEGEALKVARANHAAVESQLKNIENMEDADRTSLGETINVFRTGVKEAFPEGSPVRKQFHVGDVWNNVSKIAIGFADDIEKAYPDYQDELKAKGGILAEDLTTLIARRKKLEATSAEHVKIRTKNLKEANADLHGAHNQMKHTSDFIHAIVAIEFVHQPVILRQFEATRQLRHTTSHKHKPAPVNPKEDPTKPPDAK